MFARGEIVGNYSDRDGAQHGFVLRDGKVTTIDHPRAARGPNLTGTRVNGIDDRGRLVGASADENVRRGRPRRGRCAHGKRGRRSQERPPGERSALARIGIRAVEGTLTTFDPPGIRGNEVVDVNVQGDTSIKP